MIWRVMIERARLPQIDSRAELIEPRTDTPSSYPTHCKPHYWIIFPIGKVVQYLNLTPLLRETVSLFIINDSAIHTAVPSFGTKSRCFASLLRYIQHFQCIRTVGSRQNGSGLSGSVPVHIHFSVCVFRNETYKSKNKRLISTAGSFGFDWNIEPLFQNGSSKNLEPFAVCILWDSVVTTPSENDR